MDIKDVENLANLARLELSDEEKQAMLKDMRGILEYVKQIEGVEVPEDAISSQIPNVWREDNLNVIPRDFSKDKIIDQFPDSRDGYLKVKKIL
jgi:aspartyl-tRNA(Asn)/glutamyl-tRNA(Gln) amidotransferase subunit C